MPSFYADLVPEPARRLRRGDRRQIRTKAQCRRGTMRETVEILDLSPGGARVRAVAPLRIGFAIWIRLPGIEPQEARVVWTQGFESGCEFACPLHPAVFDALVAGRIGSNPR